MRGRWLLFWLGVAAWFAVVTAWIGSDQRVATTAFDVFSTYNTSPGGLSLAHGYLRSRRGESRVARLIDPSEISRLQSGDTLFRIGNVWGGEKWWEERGAKSEERGARKTVLPLLDDHEDDWVRRGGRLVLAITGPYRQVSAEAVDCSEFRSVFPLEPPLPTVALPQCRVLKGPGLRHFHSLLLSGTEPVLARSKHGRGEVILFSMPEVFSNEHLGKAGHLTLLDQLAGAGTVYFDESVHGVLNATSIGGLLIDWGLGPTLLLLLFAALLFFWRRARRFGPPDRPEREQRSDAIDLVDSVGQLYDRSLDREASLRLYYQALLRLVHARTGLTGEALERTVREKTAGYDPSPRLEDLSRDEFQKMLRILNHAYETVGYGRSV